jgi:hypothetical protein
VSTGWGESYNTGGEPASDFIHVPQYVIVVGLHSKNTPCIKVDIKTEGKRLWTGFKQLRIKSSGKVL